jgi:aminoglycoside/choline kinase family phosphotransferase
MLQAAAWIGGQSRQLAGLGWELDSGSMRPASSDASFRRYFRLDGVHRGQKAHLILMDAPPDKEDIRPFIHIDRLMAGCGMHVPHIVADDASQGFLLCSDLGSTTYLAALNERRHDDAACLGLYRDAWQALIKLQSFDVTRTAHGLAAYSREKLLQEMRLFDEWYLGRHLSYIMTEAERDALMTVYELVLTACLQQPAVIVHRDYHSRNLMVAAENNPGVLDFQDAVIGPISYDLVSLLRDAYVEWPEEVQIDFAARYWRDARQAGLAIADDFGAFWRDFEWMGLQRHLKVLGIFARLHHRDGKSNYLNDLPLVMRYTVSVARRYQGLGPLAKLLERLA